MQKLVQGQINYSGKPTMQDKQNFTFDSQNGLFFPNKIPSIPLTPNYQY